MDHGRVLQVQVPGQYRGHNLLEGWEIKFKI
jgi:hypothetical protein